MVMVVIPTMATVKAKILTAVVGIATVIPAVITEIPEVITAILLMEVAQGLGMKEEWITVAVTKVLPPSEEEWMKTTEGAREEEEEKTFTTPASQTRGESS